MDGRYSVKFETAHYEQTFKIRKGTGVDSLDDVHDLMDPEFQEKVLDRFNSMHVQMADAMMKKNPPSEEEFEEII